MTLGGCTSGVLKVGKGHGEQMGGCWWSKVAGISSTTLNLGHDGLESPEPRQADATCIELCVGHRK